MPACASRRASISSGSRNSELYKTAAKLAEFLPENLLTEEEIKFSLKDACERNGLIKDDGEASFWKTVSSGISKGRTNPRNIPENTKQQNEVKIVVEEKKEIENSGEIADIEKVLKTNLYSFRYNVVTGRPEFSRNKSQWSPIEPRDFSTMFCLIRQFEATKKIGENVLFIPILSLILPRSGLILTKPPH